VARVGNEKPGSIRTCRAIFLADASHRPVLESPANPRPKLSVCHEARHGVFYEKVKESVICSRDTPPKVGFGSARSWANEADCEVKQVSRFDRHRLVTWTPLCAQGQSSSGCRATD
jgi:hypothetical protein